jgi:hypothetical protein
MKIIAVKTGKQLFYHNLHGPHVVVVVELKVTVKMNLESRHETLATGVLVTVTMAVDRSGISSMIFIIKKSSLQVLQNQCSILQIILL